MQQDAQEPRIIKIAAISDTHGNNSELKKAIESNLEGDLFIHAGDFTSYNKRAHFLQFVDLLAQLKFKNKIVIAGNHQLLLDSSISQIDRKQFGIFHVFDDMSKQRQKQRLQQIGVTYLQHDYVEIEGIKIFGSPYTKLPYYSYTAFQLSEEKLKQIWGGVPQNIDILITHGPPYQILDKSLSKESCGSHTIREYLEKAKVKIHIFGHIHESKGEKKYGDTLCVNVAEKMRIINLNL